jgi:signal transduction histidine kinase
VLERLRRSLTLLFMLAALLLLLLVTGGVWAALTGYFGRATDLALHHRMADAFRSLAAPLPADLAGLLGEATATIGPQRSVTVDEATAVRSAILSVGGQLETVQLRSDGVYLIELSGNRRVEIAGDSGEVLAVIDTVNDPLAGSDGQQSVPAFEAELAATYVLPLDRDGRLLFNPNALGAPPQADQAALAAALAGGRDLRTVTVDGRNVRLLTYRLTRDDGPAALQVGRLLGDQQAVLQQLLAGLLLFGSIGILLIGVASWWIAGRAIVPTEQAWRRQQRFIAGASHELRTPLTLIRASAEIARKPTRSAEQRDELLGDIISETDHMRRLVDDLLLLSRLDSGALPLQRGLVEARPWFNDLSRQVQGLSAEHEISWPQVAADLVLDVDADRLRQIILILLDNAVRYTPPAGTITVSLTTVGQFCRIAVCDNGSGIAAEHLPQLFQPFFRVDDARRHSSNAGLGLAIAQGLVQAHGGTIEVTSSLGQGTCVTFTMPLARPNSTPERAVGRERRPPQ